MIEIRGYFGPEIKQTPENEAFSGALCSI